MRVALRLRTQNALHDGLIRAPVPHSEYGIAKEDRVPVQAHAAVGLEHAQLIRLYRRPEFGKRVNPMSRQGQNREDGDGAGTDQEKRRVDRLCHYHRL